MWWLYVKAGETADLIIYRYSTESDHLDGEIVYSKTTEEWKVTRPCARDMGSTWRIGKSEGKFLYVVEEGFPVRRRVVIG